MQHIPVLLDEVITVLQPLSGGRYIDATAGDGGHSFALLEASSPDGSVLSLDQDVNQVAIATARLAPFGRRSHVVVSRFSEIETVAHAHGFTQVQGILFDLGFSSRQLDTPSYGLTFQDDAPLDMRLSAELPMTAGEFLTYANEQEIADVLYRYGDRHNSRTLARKLVNYRKKYAFTVARDVKEALQLFHPGALAPIFQALRIHVNQEYKQLEEALPQAVRLLAPGGVLAIISFHSGEDRIVKQFLRENRTLLNSAKHIVQPTFTEIKRNPRSRSAKLRYATKREEAKEA